MDSWDGKITVKSDFADSGYKGEGSYKFKLGFYYLKSTGEPSSVNWSLNTSDITINENDPTFTPTPTPTLGNTSTPTISPTQTSTPTPSVTLVSPSEMEEEVLASESSLSLLSFSTPSATPKQKIKAFAAARTNIFLPIFILVGFVFLLTCGILIFRNIIKGRNEEISNKKL